MDYVSLSSMPCLPSQNKPAESGHDNSDVSRDFVLSRFPASNLHSSSSSSSASSLAPMQQQQLFDAYSSVRSRSSAVDTILRPVQSSASVGIGESSYPYITCLGCVKIKESGSEDATRKSELLLVSQKEAKPKGCKKTVLEQLRRLTVGIGKRHSNSNESRPTVHPNLVFRRHCSSISAETRRDRSATLATSVICLLKDTRAQDSHYTPAVPPPNSLLLMRGVAKMVTGVDSFKMKMEAPWLHETANGGEDGHLQKKFDKKVPSKKAEAQEIKLGAQQDFLSKPRGPTLWKKGMADEEEALSKPSADSIWGRRAISVIDRRSIQ